MTEIKNKPKYYIKFAFLLLILLNHSCKEREGYYKVQDKVETETEPYIYLSLEDTLRLKERVDINMELCHVISDTLVNRNTNRKVVNARVIFTTDNKLSFSDEKFINECDTIFASVKRIQDSIPLVFAYTPYNTGKNKLMIEFEEKNYFMVKKDSIRLITSLFYLEKEFIVIPAGPRMSR